MKCSTCSKKIKLVEEISSKCKCGKVNCSSHREDHNCDFDYKAEFVKSSQTTMVQVVASKIEKI